MATQYYINLYLEKEKMKNFDKFINLLKKEYLEIKIKWNKIVEIYFSLTHRFTNPEDLIENFIKENNEELEIYFHGSNGDSWKQYLILFDNNKKTELEPAKSIVWEEWFFEEQFEWELYEKFKSIEKNVK